ncbi:MAG: hypothetical protein ACBR12_03250 [Microcoleus sp.]
MLAIKQRIISIPLTSELLFLSSLSLCPLCSLWFNHSDTTGNDITIQQPMQIEELGGDGCDV